MLQRDSSVDALRGLAVFFMVASHTVWFLSNGENVVWNFIRSLGDAVCYIVFLLVFGITSYFTLFKKEYSRELRNKSFSRLLKLLLAYYIIAFLGISRELVANFDLKKIIEVITFYRVPGFTEFMLPFIFYSLIFLLLKKSKLMDSLFSKKYPLQIILISGFISFTIGTSIAYLNNSFRNERLSPFIATITGGADHLRFPLLQYSIVVFLGVYIGYILILQQSFNFGSSDKRSTTERKPPDHFILKSSLLFFIITMILWATEVWRNVHAVNMFTRWPPSILFITTGLSFTFISFKIVRLANNTFFIKYLNLLGKYAIFILVSHISILRILELFQVKKTDNTLLLALEFCILLNTFWIYYFFDKKLLIEKLTG